MKCDPIHEPIIIDDGTVRVAFRGLLGPAVDRAPGLGHLRVLVEDRDPEADGRRRLFGEQDEEQDAEDLRSTTRSVHHSSRNSYRGSTRAARRAGT